MTQEKYVGSLAKLNASPGFITGGDEAMSEKTAYTILQAKERLHQELCEGRYQGAHFTDRCKERADAIRKRSGA